MDLQQLFEGEDRIGQVYDTDEGTWTDCYLWYEDKGDSHCIRLRKGPTQKIMIEMRGVELGSVITEVLKRWMEDARAKGIQSEQVTTGS